MLYVINVFEEAYPQCGGIAGVVAYGRQKRIDSTSQLPQLNIRVHPRNNSETVFTEKHGVWDPMTELPITSFYVDSRLQRRLQHMNHGKPMPESTLALCHSRLYPPVSG